MQRRRVFSPFVLCAPETCVLFFCPTPRKKKEREGAAANDQPEGRRPFHGTEQKTGRSANHPIIADPSKPQDPTMNSTNGGNTVQSTILGVKHMPSDNNNDDNPLDEDSLLDVCDSPENKRHQYAQRSVSSASKSSGNCTLLDDRRMRRQIANCNERRRMQSINAGFQALRQFLPQRNGEKLSKAAILQQTAELIQTLQLGKGQQELSDMEAERPQCKKRRVEIKKETNDEKAQMETQIAAHLKTIDELRAKITIYEQNLTELKAALARATQQQRASSTEAKNPDPTSPLYSLAAIAELTALYNNTMQMNRQQQLLVASHLQQPTTTTTFNQPTYFGGAPTNNQLPLTSLQLIESLSPNGSAFARLPLGTSSLNGPDRNNLNTILEALRQLERENAKFESVSADVLVR